MIAHVPIHLRRDRFVVQRAERGGHLEGVAQAHGLGLGEHGIDEGVVHVALDQDSLGRTADLT